MSEVVITCVTVVGGWGVMYDNANDHLQHLARAWQLARGDETSEVFPLRDPRYRGDPEGPVPGVYARYVGEEVVAYWEPKYEGFPYRGAEEAQPKSEATVRTPASVSTRREPSESERNEQPEQNEQQQQQPEQGFHSRLPSEQTQQWGSQWSACSRQIPLVVTAPSEQWGTEPPSCTRSWTTASCHNTDRSSLVDWESHGQGSVMERELEEAEALTEDAMSDITDLNAGSSDEADLKRPASPATTEEPEEPEISDGEDLNCADSDDDVMIVE